MILYKQKMKKQGSPKKSLESDFGVGHVVNSLHLLPAQVF